MIPVIPINTNYAKLLCKYITSLDTINSKHVKFEGILKAREKIRSDFFYKKIFDLIVYFFFTIELTVKICTYISVSLTQLKFVRSHIRGGGKVGDVKNQLQH